MKYLVFCIPCFLFLLASCGENEMQLHDGVDNTITYRSSPISEFYDNVADSVYYDSSTEEYVVEILEDFEYKPDGSSEWIKASGGIRVKIKCTCRQQQGHGGCDPSVTISGNDVTVGCDDPCTATCKMRSKIKGLVSGITVDEFESGAEYKPDDS